MLPFRIQSGLRMMEAVVVKAGVIRRAELQSNRRFPRQLFQGSRGGQESNRQHTNHMSSATEPRTVTYMAKEN